MNQGKMQKSLKKTQQALSTAPRGTHGRWVGHIAE